MHAVGVLCDNRGMQNNLCRNEFIMIQDVFLNIRHSSFCMSQSLSHITVHIIFSTKNREPLIKPCIESELYAFLISHAVKLGNYVHAIGGIDDHIHMSVVLNKTLSVSNLIEELKKNSSRWIKTRGKQYETFAWQKGYGAFAISSTHKDRLKHYISNQKEHHKTISFEDEFRSLLMKNETPFDERYVWD